MHVPPSAVAVSDLGAVAVSAPGRSELRNIRAR